MYQTYLVLLLLGALLATRTSGMPQLYYNNDESRIINGTDVPPGKYPSMVSLTRGTSHSCAGTIINEYWVLTAAHCVLNDDPAYYQIFSGSVDRKSGGTYHQVAEFLWHDRFNYATALNDIALIRVETPFVWDANTAPVPLPDQDQITEGGVNATVIGWGITESSASSVDLLKEVDYWTTTDQECIDAHTKIVFETNICAYYPNGGKGQCNGDSGGPLWARGVQVGIVSWSQKPCGSPYPGVFTEVSPYIEWIKQCLNK